MLFPNLSNSESAAWMQSYYDICGNASIEQAEIVIVTDIYDDERNTSKNVACVNQIWDNHLVLVEDTPLGQQIESTENRLSKGINEKAIITGCDNPEFKACIERMIEQEKRIDCLAKRVIADLEEGSWGLFLSDNGDFAALLEFGSESNRREKKTIRKLLDDGMQYAFMMSVKEAVADVKRNHNQLVYGIYAYFWQSRLDHLKEAIEYGVRLYKKVIVLVSCSLVIPNPSLKDSKFNLRKITQYLSENPFVILNAKHSPFSVDNQPELWCKPAPQQDALPAPSEFLIKNPTIISPTPLKFSSLPKGRLTARRDALIPRSNALERIDGPGPERKVSSIFFLETVLCTILEEDDEAEQSMTSATASDDNKLDSYHTSNDKQKS